MTSAREIIEGLEKMIQPSLTALEHRIDDLEADLIRLRQEHGERESDRRWTARRLRELADTIERLPELKTAATKSAHEGG